MRNDGERIFYICASFLLIGDWEEEKIQQEKKKRELWRKKIFFELASVKILQCETLNRVRIAFFLFFEQLKELFLKNKNTIWTN